VAGGELVVLLDTAFSGSWPAGLDPATNVTGGANLSQMSSIYGGLFRLEADDDGSNAQVVPHQAESYELADEGRTLRIKLRPGIQFTDGTPLDAEAVAFNFRRAITTPCTCAPPWAQPGVLADPDLNVAITTEGTDTVVVRFANPNAAVVTTMTVSNVNWIASPSAIQAAGADAFRINPVGAGPFKVVTNNLNQELALEKNTNYFVPDRPYLDKLTFRSIGGDQPAYNAIVAGDADAYEGATTIPLLDLARSNPQVTLTQQPASSPYVIQLNTRIPPFNNKELREAIYYATDAEAIAQGLFGGRYPTAQTFTAPGGLFHHDTIPGYRTYDLAKAKAIIDAYEAANGPLTVDLGTLDAYVARLVNTELQRQWEAAGITTTIHADSLQQLIGNFIGGQWQAMLQTAGAWDPAAGVGVAFRFASTFPFSGVTDETIDDLLQQGAQTVDPGQRDDIYLQLGQRISDEAYAPYILAFAPATIARKGVHGPGVDTFLPTLVVNTAILWDSVWKAQS
jgi:peptide/nickel transport system substrate-binding protein